MKEWECRNKIGCIDPRAQAVIKELQHLDNTTTIGNANAASNMPPAARGGDLKSPNGRLELYERDFGGGKKLYTFVIRA